MALWKGAGESVSQSVSHSQYRTENAEDLNHLNHLWRWTRSEEEAADKINNVVPFKVNPIERECPIYKKSHERGIENVYPSLLLLCGLRIIGQTNVMLTQLAWFRCLVR